MTQEISISTLINPSEEELAKIILSSADRFEGLYRVTSALKKTLDNEIFMKWMDFFQTAYLSSTQKKCWTRSEWFKAQMLLEPAYKKEGLIEETPHEGSPTSMKERYQKWTVETQNFSLAVIDNVTPVEDIECGKTYYMMGSLLRFEENQLLVGWNEVQKTAYCTLHVSFKTLREHIRSSFSPQAVSELFLRADIIAHLEFRPDHDEGLLTFDLAKIENTFHEFAPQSIVMAAVAYPQGLPIQFSKPLGVSNVLL